MVNVKKEERPYFFKPYERLLVGLGAFLAGGATGGVIGVLVLSVVMLSNPVTTGIWLGVVGAVVFTFLAVAVMYAVERCVRKLREAAPSPEAASTPSRQPRQRPKNGRQPPRYNFRQKEQTPEPAHPSSETASTAATTPDDLLRVAKEIVDETLYVAFSKLENELNNVAKSELVDGTTASIDLVLPVEMVKLKAEFEAGLKELKEKFQNLMTESLKGPNSADYQAAKSELEKYAKRQLPLLYHPDKHQDLKPYYECMFKTLYAFYEKNEQAVEMLQKGLKFPSDAQSLHEMRERIFRDAIQILWGELIALKQSMKESAERDADYYRNFRERRAADQAAHDAQRAADQAARDAQRAADQAARDAQRAADQAALDARFERLERMVEQRETAPPTHLPSQPFATTAEEDVPVTDSKTSQVPSFASTQNGGPS